MAANVGLSRVLTQLQSANVGYDAPTIARRNLLGVIGHGTEPGGHHVKEITKRSLAQTVGVIRRRMLKAARWNHSVAVTQPRVAWRAKNIEALPAAIENFLSDGKWHVVARLVADHSGIEICVLVKLAARDGALDRLALRSKIRIEVALCQWLEPRLVMHVVAAAGEDEENYYTS